MTCSPIATRNPPIEIPEGWEQVPLKYACEINPDSLSGDEADEEEIEYVDISSVDSLGNIQDTTRTTIEESPSRAQRLVQDGDTIVSTVRTYLKAIAHVEDPPENMVVSTGFAVLRPSSEFDPEYLRWVIQSKPYIKWIVGNSTGVSYPAIASTTLGSLKIPLPPEPVQENICSYLQSHTSQIDKLIGEKKKLRDLLEDRNQSLISEAITSQTEEPELKLDRLENLPKNWDVTPLKYQVEIGSGSTPSRSKDEYWDGGIPWVTAKDMKRNEIYQTKDQITEEALDDSNISLFPSGTTVVLVRGMILDHTFPVCILGEEGYVNQDVKALISSGDLEEEFLFRMMQGMAPRILAMVEESSHGTKKLEMSRLKNLRIPVPPKESQREMCEKINEKTKIISNLTDKIETSIDLLKEKRQALITAAVTGQIDMSKEKGVIQGDD